MKKLSSLAFCLLIAGSLGLAACRGGEITEIDPSNSDTPVTPVVPENPEGPEISTITAITVNHDLFSIVGRGYFLTLEFSEPIKTETAAFQLQILLSVATKENGELVANFGNMNLENTTWSDDRKSLTIQVPPYAHHLSGSSIAANYGSYLFSLKADGDEEGHRADTEFQFSIDQDSDGVVDKNDECDRTPAATENGCPADAGSDSDGDGVADDLDKCPTTKAGEPVDDTGCAKASDEPIWIVPGNILSYTINPAYIAKLFPEPKVIESIPPRDATSVPTNWPIVIKFNQPMDPESVKQHVKLKLYWVLSWMDEPMDFVTSYGDCNEEKQCNVFQFKPASPLKADKIYGIVIEKGIKGVNGESTVEDSWAFHTK